MVTQSLNAWMNGELVGTWLVDRNSHAFRYEPVLAGVAPPAIAFALAAHQRIAGDPGPGGPQLLRQPAAGQRTDPLAAAPALRPTLWRDLRSAGGHRPGLRRCRAAPARGRHPGGLGSDRVRRADRGADRRPAAGRAVGHRPRVDPRRRPVPDLHRRRPGEDRTHPMEGQMVPASWRHAHHPHHQAAAGSHRWLEAGRCIGLGSERMAVRADRRGARAARRLHVDGDLRRPDRA